MNAKQKFPGPSGTIFSEIDHIGTTGSTNADLLDYMRAGGSQGAVLVADHQSAGRGRQARNWLDEPGNSVLMSVSLNPSAPVAPLSPLIGGIAVVDALNQLDAEFGYLGVDRFGLKWPNDVLVPSMGEKKLAGILSEAITVPDASGEPCWAVVLGIGLNLRWSQTLAGGVGAGGVALEDVFAQSIDRWVLVEHLLVAIDRVLGQAERQGPAPLVAQYRDRCLTLGRQVRFVTSTGEVEGIASGIGDDGALLVQTPNAIVSLVAGDAHHV